MIRLAIVSLCAFAGAFFSSLTGFGGAITFLAIAALASQLLDDLPVRHVIMLGIFRSWVTNPITVYLGGRKPLQSDPRLFMIFVPAVIIGSPLGQYVLYLLPADALRPAVGAVCLVAAAERLVGICRQRKSAAAATDVEARAIDAAEEATIDAAEETGSGAAGQVVAAAEPSSTTTNAVPATPDSRSPAAAASSQARDVAAAFTGFACGLLGASLGTTGPPLMVFVAYFPLDKTLARSLICGFGIPCQTIALASFTYRGVLAPERDWPDLLCVIVFGVVGVGAGNKLHQRIDTDIVGKVVLFFLAAASIEMLTEDAGLRLLCALALGALGLGTRHCGCGAAAGGGWLSRLRRGRRRWASI